jgi:hypothetical protein
MPRVRRSTPTLCIGGHRASCVVVGCAVAARAAHAREAGLLFNGRARVERRDLYVVCSCGRSAPEWPAVLRLFEHRRKHPRETLQATVVSRRHRRAHPAAKHPPVRILNRAEAVSWRCSHSKVASELMREVPMHNKAVETDAQGRPRAWRRASILGRRSLLR